MRRILLPAAFASAITLLAGCGGGSSSTGSTSWYAHWWCTVAQCAVVMGGSSGVAGPFSQSQECEQWRQTYILTSVCNTSPTSGGTTPPAPPPTITTFPASTRSGAYVLVDGTNFTADAVVTFAGSARAVSNVYATHLEFFVPMMGSFTGPIRVTTAGGTAVSSGSLQVLNDLQGVAWSGSNFVVVGVGEDILTSPDGITWTARAANLPATGAWTALYGVAAMGSRVVAVGYGGRTTVSTDHGLTWMGAQASAMGNLYAVTSTGAQFVASGDSYFQTSPDGIAWTPRTPPNFTQRRDITWSGSLLLATGGGAGHALATSTDGVTWSEPASAASFRGMNGVATSGLNAVAVGSLDTAFNSDGVGVTWSGLPPIAAQNSVTSRGTGFLAVGPSGAVQTSRNGSVWNPSTSVSANALNRVACSPSLCVAVGDQGTIVTNDGLTWTTRATP